MTRSIIAWGDVERHWKRLGIAPTKTFDGLHDFTARLSVWEVDEAQWNQLLADESRPNAEEVWDGACWRYAEGSTFGTSTDFEFMVNSQILHGFRRAWDPGDGEDDLDENAVIIYDDLLVYLCDELGISTESNVTAVALDLARANGMTLGELFTKYMPADA